MKTTEHWTFVTRLEADGDMLFKSNQGRYLVACELPCDLDDPVDEYVLDIDGLRSGDVRITPSSGYVFGFPRIGYRLSEEYNAAKKLHKALYKEGVMPREITFSYTFDAEEA